MLVSERAYAAAYTRSMKGRATDASVFDDIACLLKAARAETDPGALDFWFHDPETREWIDGRTAVIVSSPDFRTPMSGGMLAYPSRAAAERAAARGHGRVLGTVQEILKEGTR
jgi:hypothetical protein